MLARPYFFPLRVGRQAVPAPIQFGISHRAKRDSEIPNLKEYPLSRCDRNGRLIQNRDLCFGAKQPSQIAILNGSGDTPPPARAHWSPPHA